MNDYASEPSGAGALVGAIDWLRSALLGSAATSVAMLAIAAVGLLLLSGRMSVRRGATVVLGCFILFSASAIADGILTGARASQTEAINPPPPPPPSIYTPRVPTPAPYDPYAGASLPAQQERPMIR